MKKFVLLCSLILLIYFNLFPAQTAITCADSFSKVKVITNYADVLSSTDSSAEVLFVAIHKDVFNLASDEEIISGNQGYYKLSIEGYANAYIKSHQVMIVAQQNISNLISPNAYFRKKVNTATLYIYSGAQYREFCTINVDQTTPIRITSGYDRKKEFTQIQILIEDEIVNVYVKTEIIKSYGIPVWLKVVLYIIGSILVGAMITLISIYAKKAKKKIDNA